MHAVKLSKCRERKRPPAVIFTFRQFLKRPDTGTEHHQAPASSAHACRQTTPEERELLYQRQKDACRAPTNRDLFSRCHQHGKQHYSQNRESSAIGKLSSRLDRAGASKVIIVR